MRFQKLSRIQKLLAAAATAFLASAGTASAISMDFSYSVSYMATNGNGPSLTNDLTSPYSASIGTTQTTPTNFFTASPAGSCGTGCTNNTASGTITVTFTFTAPVATTFTETATYQAKYSGTALSCTNSPNGETDCIDWAGASNSGYTGVLTVAVGSGLDMYLSNASDWSISPQISFQDVPGPAGAPGPVSGSGVPGVALAIGVLGLVGWRSRRKAQVAKVLL